IDQGQSSQGDKMPARRVVVITGAIAFLGFLLYLSILWRQLTVAFFQQEQFIPTRIYSDVTRIAPPQTRGQIEDRLKSLAYQPKSAETEILFRLHGVDYPYYLVPDGHPILDAKNLPITLHFDGPQDKALLKSIDIAGKEV